MASGRGGRGVACSYFLPHRQQNVSSPESPRAEQLVYPSGGPYFLLGPSSLQALEIAPSGAISLSRH